MSGLVEDGVLASSIDSPEWKEVLRVTAEEVAKVTRTGSGLGLSIIDGTGRSAPVETNKNGGKGSKRLGLTLLPFRALVGVAERMRFGAEKYKRHNWRQVTVEEHLDHVLGHAGTYLDMVREGLDVFDGETRADHLKALATRALMALEVELAGGAIDQERSDEMEERMGY